MPTDLQRIDFAMTNSRTIHFNTEGFVPPKGGRATRTEFGEPVGGRCTDYEFRHVMRSHQDKTYFWQGDAPDFNANLQPGPF